MRPPDWAEFLEGAVGAYTGAKQHVKKLLKQQDHLTACEIIKQKLGDNWHGYVHAQFVAPRFQPADIHRDIFKLDARVVLTQNVDKVYDTFALAESQNTIYVREYFHDNVGRFVRGDHRCVLKAHGSVDSVDQMVFTREEYAKARYAFPRFYALLDAFVLTHTFLFVGCGLADPDVRLMLERHAHVFPVSRPHVMIMPAKAAHADVRECFERNMNLQFLTYSGADHHKELRESISELVSRVDEERNNLATSRDW
jgi:hypothetical protein